MRMSLAFIPAELFRLGHPTLVEVRWLSYRGNTNSEVGILSLPHPLKRGQWSMWSYHVVCLQAREYLSDTGKGKTGFEHMIQSEAETIQQSTADARVVNGVINATNTTIIGRGIGQLLFDVNNRSIGGSTNAEPCSMKLRT